VVANGGLQGTWTSFWDHKTIKGPQWVKETHGFDTLPLYVREGTILVLGNEGEKRTVYDWTKPENHEVGPFASLFTARALTYRRRSDCMSPPQKLASRFSTPRVMRWRLWKRRKATASGRSRAWKSECVTWARIRITEFLFCPFPRMEQPNA
jgi:hypothetical protein